MRIFVFCSNREGRHGAGAAKDALEQHGAIYGQAEGLQGQSYAIVTKELRDGYLPVKLFEIACGILRFLVFAAGHPEHEFDVTAIGCGLAGFSAKQIAPFFAGATANVYLPHQFLRFLPKEAT